MTYTAGLEALDRKAGRIHTVDDWRRVGEKSQHAPATLTDDDLTILEGFDGSQAAARARARREKALNPAPPEPPAAVTKAAEPAAPEPREEESWDDLVARCPGAPVPLALFDQIEKFVKAMNAKNAERNAKIATLEAEVEKLRSRPLQKWAGVHIAGVPYAEASLVTKSGSLWVATTTTTTTPGEPGGDWRLIVKRGHA